MENQSLRLGPYRDLTYLGKGSFVCVYRATDQHGRPVALRFVFRGGKEQLEQYMQAVMANAAVSSLPEQHKATSEEIQQASSEVVVLRELSSKCSVVPKFYGAYFDADSLLPDIPVIAMELVTEREIRSHIEDAQQKGRSPIIPEVYALEMARKTLEALDLLHKQGRHLFDAQIKNYRINFPDKLPAFPLRPDDLEFHLLDWNGTLTLDESQEKNHLASPQGFDAWMTFAFLFEMLTGTSVVEHPGGLSYHRLMGRAGWHWEHISPGTRELLRYVLAFERGQHAFTVSDVCGWLAHRLKVWESQGMGLQDELDRVPYYLDFTEEAAWFARVFPHNQALVQQEQALSKSRARLEKAAQDILQNGLQYAIRYPQSLPEHVLTLDELRNKIIINTLRSDAPKLQESDRYAEIAQALGTALDHVYKERWEKLHQENPLRQVSDSSDGVSAICKNLDLEASIRVTWNDQLRALARNPHQISEWALDEIDKTYKALHGIVEVLVNPRWSDDAKNGFSDRIACDLLGQSWQPAHDGERPAHIAQLISLKRAVAEKKDQLSTLQERYEKLSRLLPPSPDTFRQIVSACPEDFREHPIHLEYARKIADQLATTRGSANAAHFVQGIFNSLPWGPARAELYVKYRPFGVAGEIISMLRYPADDAHAPMKRLLDELQKSDEGMKYLLQQLDSTQVDVERIAGSFNLSDGVFALIEQTVKDSRFPLDDLWHEWRDAYFEAIRYRLRVTEDYSETCAYLQKIPERAPSRIRINEVLGKLAELKRKLDGLPQSPSEAGGSSTATMDSARAYTAISTARDIRDRAHDVEQHISAIESTLDGLKLGWLRCQKADVQDRLVDSNAVLVEYARRLAASHGALDQSIQTLNDLPPQFSKQLEGLDQVQKSFGKRLDVFDDQQAQLAEIGGRLNTVQGVTEYVSSLAQNLSRRTTISLVLAVVVLVAVGALAIALLTSLSKLSGAVDGNTAALADIRTEAAQQLEESIARIEDSVAQQGTEIGQTVGVVGELRDTVDALLTPTYTPMPTPTDTPAPPTETPTPEPTDTPAPPPLAPVEEGVSGLASPIPTPTQVIAPAPDALEDSEVAAAPVAAAPDEAPETTGAVGLSASEMATEQERLLFPPALQVSGEASEVAGQIRVIVQLRNRESVPLTSGTLKLAFDPSMDAARIVSSTLSGRCSQSETASESETNAALEVNGITMYLDSVSALPCVITIEITGVERDAAQPVFLSASAKFAKSNGVRGRIRLDSALAETTQGPADGIELSEDRGGSGD